MRRCFKCSKQFNATTFTDRLPHQVMICLDCQKMRGIMRPLDIDELRCRVEDQDEIIGVYEDSLRSLILKNQALIIENEKLKDEIFDLNCRISEGVFK
jgi:hypothetical protein